MFAPAPSVLLALVLLDGPPVALPSAATCQTGVQHVALQAAPTGEAQAAKVCISPGQATTLSFDTDFVHESLTVEGREKFTKVDAGQSTVKLIPSEKLVPGERLKLTVRFKGDDAPAGAALQLVVHTLQATPYVEVHREKRTVESCQRELSEKDAALQQYRADNERLRAERSGPGGLSGLRASGVIDESGVVVHGVTRNVTGASTSPLLRAWRVIAYRSVTRVAVEVLPEDAPEWKPESATLTLPGKKGVELKVLTVWTSEPSSPGPRQRTVFVEAEMTPDVATGAFTLKLWDVSGTRTMTISGITFP